MPEVTLVLDEELAEEVLATLKTHSKIVGEVGGPDGDFDEFTVYPYQKAFESRQPVQASD